MTAQRDPRPDRARSPCRRIVFTGRLALALAGACALEPLAPPASALAQSADAKTFDVAIRGRKAVAPVNVIQVKQGDVVELKLVTDEQVDVHLHGYDIKLTLSPDAPGTMRFNARLSGRFPLESHGFGTASASQGHRGSGPLLYIEVHPR